MLSFVATALSLRQTAPVTATPDVPRTARERARAEITGEILSTARQHLARDGAAALSLRAIARDLGMVSSAVYRYVPNRDALLTMLIIDAYDTVGAQVEQAAAACPRADYLGRFLATCRALRAWALANPHEYALIYGSPVPGYAAPADTIAPATRVPIVLLSILFDQTADGAAAPGDPAVARPSPRASPRSASSRAARPRTTSSLRGLASWGPCWAPSRSSCSATSTTSSRRTRRARSAFFDHQMRQVAIGLGPRGEPTTMAPATTRPSGSSSRPAQVA